MTLAISPCPNDTFAFHALRNEYRLVFDDVDGLNRRAERGEFDLTKISVAAYGRLREEYALLRAGGAAGYGVGPIVVAPIERGVGGRVAIPGERTTAALLLRLLGEFETVAMRFDRIADAVLAGEADCGVLIHEGRFTFERKGLTQLCDLGTLWETRMGLPLPLGAIAIRRTLGPELARRVDDAIRRSIAHAMAHPDESADFVRVHAQEMDPEVVRRHIELYVNEYTLQLEERAVHRLLAFGEEQGFFPPSASPLFAC
ncbi:MAG: 1,4-dihydroxy-6-naphthoate synthase [Planctomycetota bacterium]